MNDDFHIPFDRITYRDGQLLTALDLRDDQSRHARLRGLHKRFLHQTWGIALGLTVSKVDAGKAVVIAPGAAVDNAGRDILLAEGIHEPVPSVSGSATFVLTVQYQENAAFRERADLAALCLSGGLDPRHERPVFRWRVPEDVRFGPQVPVVQIEVENGKINGDLDFRVRRYTRALVCPHIASGVTESGRTSWKAWSEEHTTLGLEVIVDTTEAGFIKTPYYFVTLQGDFSNVQPEVWPTGMGPKFSLGATSFITDVARDSFTYRMIHGEGFPFGAEVNSGMAEEREWALSWWGVEPVTGCEPALYLAELFTRAGGAPNVVGLLNVP